MLDLPIQRLQLLQNLLLLDRVHLVLCVFPNCFKVLFFKNRIKEQKLRAFEIKVQCIPRLYSCELLISWVQAPIFKKFCIKFGKPL